MKKQAEISRNPMIYNNLEFEKPMKMVDFCRSREITILRFRHLLEANNLAFQMLATVNPSSTPNDASC